MSIIKSHRELIVYNNALDAAVGIHFLVRRFPRNERWLLTDQMLRCTRSVPANLAEAWRKRGYMAHFISKLSDAQAEAAEAQVWLEFAYRVKYIDEPEFTQWFTAYDTILAQMSVMSRDARKWTKR
jgi:four helix bundle protein